MYEALHTDFKDKGIKVIIIVANLSEIFSIRWKSITEAKPKNSKGTMLVKILENRTIKNCILLLFSHHLFQQTCLEFMCNKKC